MTRKHRQAFTLVELLTVIAIIGVLASLLMAAVTSAKKASHRARCMSNLRQISLALNMYVDDCEKRSPDLAHLTSSRYLPNRQVLLCPADTTGGWGNLVNPATMAANLTYVAGSDLLGTNSSTTNNIPFSYLNPLPWEDWAWERLAKLGSRAGLAACQLHGLGKPNLDSPSYLDFQGVLLRAQRDGAVVQREVYWDSSAVTGNMASSSPNTIANNASLTVFNYPWKLFSDE